MTTRGLNEYMRACQHYYLRPGYIYVAKNPTVMKTVLGSCISVCIYDFDKKIAGINHFMLPVSSDNEQTPRYGKPAIIGLLRLMVGMGSNKQNLVSRIIGGAGNDGGSGALSVGYENILIARKILSKYGIPIQSEDVGGEKGRKVIYLSEYDRLFVEKLKGQ